MTTPTIKLPAKFIFSYYQDFTRELDRAFPAAMQEKRLDIDFSQVTLMDSMALGLLVNLQKKASKNGISITIKHACGTALELLNLAKMQQYFRFAS